MTKRAQMEVGEEGRHGLCLLGVVDVGRGFQPVEIAECGRMWVITFGNALLVITTLSINLELNATASIWTTNMNTPHSTTIMTCPGFARSLDCNH